MEPLLPALHNLPVFYTVLISLLAMAGLSGFVLYHRLRERPSHPRFVWLKGLVLLPLWLLGLIWTVLAAAMGVFTGGVTGSWLFSLLALLVVPVFGLISWGLYYWLRGRPQADAGMLLLVPALIFTVYATQRLWICEPLALSGLGQAQHCTARLYEQGSGGAIRNQAVALMQDRLTRRSQYCWSRRWHRQHTGFLLGGQSFQAKTQLVPTMFRLRGNQYARPYRG